MNDRFDEAWAEFAAQDRARQAPPNLERRVLEAVVEASRVSTMRAERRYSALSAACAIAAGLVAAIILGQPSPAPPEAPLLGARSFAPAPLQPAIAADTPILRPQADAGRDVALMDWIALYQDLPIVLMLDAAEAAAAEPLQLVRLRLSLDALHALGIATLGPDTGVADVDLLVGEDGLPKTIRQVRLVQEEQ